MFTLGYYGKRLPPDEERPAPAKQHEALSQTTEDVTISLDNDHLAMELEVKRVKLFIYCVHTNYMYYYIQHLTASYFLMLFVTSSESSAGALIL